MAGGEKTQTPQSIIGKKDSMKKVQQVSLYKSHPE